MQLAQATLAPSQLPHPRLLPSPTPSMQGAKACTHPESQCATRRCLRGCGASPGSPHSTASCRCRCRCVAAPAGCHRTPRSGWLPLLLLRCWLSYGWLGWLGCTAIRHRPECPPALLAQAVEGVLHGRRQHPKAGQRTVEHPRRHHPHATAALVVTSMALQHLLVLWRRHLPDGVLPCHLLQRTLKRVSAGAAPQLPPGLAYPNFQAATAAHQHQQLNGCLPRFPPAVKEPVPQPGLCIYTPHMRAGWVGEMEQGGSAATPPTTRLRCRLTRQLFAADEKPAHWVFRARCCAE